MALYILGGIACVLFGVWLIVFTYKNPNNGKSAMASNLRGYLSGCFFIYLGVELVNSLFSWW